MIDPKKAQELASLFPHKKILVIGDVYLDEYVYADAKRLSPEAPVPRATVLETHHAPGCAANVALAFRSFGAQVRIAGIIGHDEYGLLLLQDLNSQGIDTSGLVRDATRLTGRLSRILLTGQSSVPQHFIRTDYVNHQPLPDSTKNLLLDQIEKGLSWCDAVYLADYDETEGKVNFNDTLITEIIQKAKRSGVFLAGTSRERTPLLTELSLLFTNKTEAELATHQVIHDEVSLYAVALHLQQHMHIPALVITLGKDGLYFLHQQEKIRLPSLVKAVKDVCGGGDSLSAALTLGLLVGGSPFQAGVLGSLAARLAIEQPETGNVTAESLIAHSHEKAEPNTKFIRTESIEHTLEQLKSSGKTIVFTNGYFDVIHSGHIEFLQSAKKYGDILIVAINSDRSTKENKGLNRPFIKQEDRVKILSALSCVDYVTIYDELTPINIIKKVKPNVLIKGGTYTEEEVVGKEIIKAQGGKLVILPLMGPHTEALIELIRSSKKVLHSYE